MKKESWFYRLLKWIGLIKTKCVNGQSLFATETAKAVHGMSKE